MNEISVILPSYKEAENLKNILPKLNETLSKKGINYEILVIDTMEPMDESEDVCRVNGAKYIRRENGNMYGDAIRTGFAHTDSKYTVVMDADGSHDPSCIVQFYDTMKSGDCDMVIGSRYCKGGQTDNNLILQAMSWMLNLTYRVVFGIKAKDISNSFRMYKTADTKGLKLECDNFDIVEEILIKLNYMNKDFSIKEIPIRFNKRDKGESKRDLFKFIFSYLKTMKRLKEIKSDIVK
nr:glycosyltransferase [Clostridia bacterium]